MCNYNDTKLQVICADLESSPQDPVSTEDPILTNEPTPMDADDDTDDKQAEVEPPRAVKILQAKLQRGNFYDESISVDRRGRRATGATT